MTDGRDGVVLLHGLSRTALSLRKMQMALERAGFATFNLDYASRRKVLEELAEDIHPAIQHFADRIDGSVHFACHSMGGLLARVDPAQTDRFARGAHVDPFVMRNRPMEGWLRVDEAGVRTKRQLRTWVDRGVAYVRTLPPKR